MTLRLDDTASSMRVVLLVFSCHRYEHKAALQRRTWLQRVQMPYWHVLGDPDMDTDHAFDARAQVLRVRAPDDYCSLPKKAAAAFAAVRVAFPDVEYVFKTDDDQRLLYPGFLESLANVLEHCSTSQQYHYGGHVISVRDHESSYHLVHPELPPNLPLRATKYCSGRFYFLSREALDALLQRRAEVETEYFEDYAVGYYLPQALKEHMLPVQTNKYFVDAWP